MKKLLLTLTIAVGLQTFSASVAGAEYVKESDKTISINTGLNIESPLNIAKKSFLLQEAVHNNVTTTTGFEVDHYYIWLEVDGQTIVGIDPAKGMY